MRVQTVGKVQFSAGYVPSVGATSEAGTASPSRIPSSAFFWSSLSMLRLPRTRKIRSRSAGVFSAQSAIRDSVCRSKGSVRSIEFFRKCSNHCREPDERLSERGGNGRLTPSVLTTVGPILSYSEKAWPSTSSFTWSSSEGAGSARTGLSDGVGATASSACAVVCADGSDMLYTKCAIERVTRFSETERCAAKWGRGARWTMATNLWSHR